MVANVHSWCHAMIDLAEDIDGRNLGFSGKLSPDLAEGLAQYYTHCFLDDMNDPKYYDTFVELLSFQPDVYRTHMSWLTTEDLEDYKEQSVNMGAPLVKVGDDGLGYITRSREIVRHTLLTHLREQPEMNVEEFNHHFDRTGQTVKQVIDLF